MKTKTENAPGVSLNGYTRIGGALAHVPVSKRTFLRWQAQGRIAYTKIGRVTLYRMADIEKMLNKLTIRAIG